MTTSKRVFDLCAAGVGLVLLAPLLLILAALVKLSDGGSVFFVQARVGRYGRRFRLWKFRTMVPSAERTGGPLTVGNDRRITATGQWLRRWKLDELPQLFNVVRGEMSLVGPRPEVEHYVNQYTPEQRRVLEFVPGITDPASLRYRAESELLGRAEDPERLYVETIVPEKVRLNLEYVARATLWSDIAVIVCTLVPSAGPGTLRGPAKLPEVR